MNIIYHFFKHNLDIVYFFYGLAFLIMGLAQYKKESEFKFARILWLLGLFAIIHGASEFFDMWSIIKGCNFIFDLTRLIILFSSYLFLFEFGRQLLRISGTKFFLWYKWWMYLLIGIPIFILGFYSADFCRISSVWARYIFGFPSAFLTGLSLIFYYHDERILLGSLRVKKYFIALGCTFFVYSILSGIVVPRADFFPANLINSDSFLAVLKLPVEVFRFICAIIFTVSIFKVVRVFDWEKERKILDEITRRRLSEELLKKSNETLETQFRERTETLGKANEELRSSCDKLMHQKKIMISLLSDLDETRQKLRKVNQELVKVSELKSEFVSHVSHELRAPLSIMKEGVSLILDKIPGPINDAQEKIIFAVKSNIDRLARLINNLLDISKIEAEKIELKKESVDISKLIEQVLLSFNLLVKEKGIELKVFSKEGLYVYGDADRLIQVFTNLLSNALKFTEKGAIEILVKELESEFEFTIADSGVGILKENIPKVFDKFQQFDNRAITNVKGTGLGLAITKGIIEMHSGKIRVESELGKGTKFIFTLPKPPKS